MKKKRYKLLLILVIIAILAALTCYDNNRLTVKKIVINSPKIDEDFNGYRILQLSDLHNKSFGKNQQALLEAVKSEKPSIIVFTGDMIDRGDVDFTPSKNLVQGLTKIAPVYFVPGNHEESNVRYKELKKELVDMGVMILEDKTAKLEMGKSYINILGLKNYRRSEEVKQHLKANRDEFNILLAHHPELFMQYAEAGIDITFSGHAHGGQIRIPGLGGLIAPDQGLLPQYTAGVYEKNTSRLVVSRGLGNSIAPVRILNPPEIVIVTLYHCP